MGSSFRAFESSNCLGDFLRDEVHCRAAEGSISI